MATDLKPSTWLGGGYTVDTGAHVVKLTTNTASSNKILTNLTDAQADPTTGDFRQLVFALLEALVTANAAQALVTNSSDRMTISKTIGQDISGNTRFNYVVSVAIVPGTSIPSE